MRWSDVLSTLPDVRPGYVAPGGSVVKLNQNESPYSLSPEEWDALLTELRAVPMNRYPDPGHSALETSIARHTGFSPRMVLAGNGANELIELVIRSTCNPGDEVLTVAPTYHLYDRLCALNRTRLVKVGWEPDFGFPRRELPMAMSSRTGLVLLCRPNNPTGHLFPPEDVLEVAERFPGMVAVDEAYYDFAQDTLAPLTRTVRNLVVVRTLSKAYGASGLRLGYLLASAEIVERVRTLQIPYGLSGLTQAAALFFLSRPEIMKRQRDAILKGREDLARRLETLPGLTVFSSATNFLLVRTAYSADALDRYLRAHEIVIRNLKWEDRYLRISVGTPEDHIRLVAGIRAFEAAGAST